MIARPFSNGPCSSVTDGHETDLNGVARRSVVWQAAIRIRSIDLIHEQDYKAETTIKVP